MADTKRITLDEVVPHFAELEDPRSTVNLQHPLVSVVVIAMLAVLAGAGGPTAIARWAALKEQFLLDALDLPNGIPRKDVFRRVLMALRRALPGVLRDLADVVACGRGRNDWRGATHPGGGWQNAAAEPRSQERPGRIAFGQHLGQRVRALAGAGGVREKSNEITAIPELLRLVDIKGAIITIDAMGTQKAIAAEIIDGKGDYVLALKGNQETLHQAVIDYIDKQLDGDRKQACEHVTVEKGHGREETRTYLQLPAPKSLPGFTLWKGLKTVAIVTLRCVRDGKETIEVRYYISSLPMNVRRLARAVRSHWGIENGCHWVLDVTYREDESRIRQEALRENFAWLNRFTLSLLKQHSDRTSLAMKRRSCNWDDNYLLQVVARATV